MYKGKPVILKIKLNKLLNNDIFKDLAQSRSELHSILYLFPEYVAEVIKPLGKSTKDVKVKLTKKLLKDTLKETIKVNKKIDNVFKEIKDKNDLYNKIKQEEYDYFIENLMKETYENPMLTSGKTDVKNVIKSLLEQTKKVGKYHQTLVNISTVDLVKILKKCVKGKSKGEITITCFLKSMKASKGNAIYPFVIFLTKNQKRILSELTIFEQHIDIVLSNTQFHKTCFAMILLNRDIYHLKNYGTLAPPLKIKRITTPLAIEMKNLINFDEPELIPTSKPKPKLIPTSKPKPKLIPTSKPKPELIPTSKPDPLNKIMEKKLIRF